MRIGRNDRGASSIEYAMLASFVAAVIVAVVAGLGVRVIGLFSSVVFP